MDDPRVGETGPLAAVKSDQGLRSSTLVLILLLSGDFFYLFLHWMYLACKTVHIPVLSAAFNPYAFSVTADLGLAESFGYVKEFWIVLILAWLIFQKRLFSYVPWALVFAYLLFDDMLTLHEKWAGYVLTKLGLLPEQTVVAKLRYQDFGEVGVSLVFGVLFLALIIVMYARGSKGIRATFKVLIGGVFLLAAFGIITDLVSHFFTGKIMNYLAVTVEDGGELVTLSFICWYVLTLQERLATPAPSA